MFLYGLILLFSISINCNGHHSSSYHVGNEYLKFAESNIFEDYVAEFGKQYKDEDEYNFRYNVFHDNMRKVRVLQRYEWGSATYGITQFSDLTASEYRNLLGFMPHLRTGKSTMIKASIPDVTPPTKFDWREKNVVSEVKNQGTCGSCWAFSVTGNVEGLYAIKHAHLYSLSEQELVDCDTKDHGCAGGLPENAYEAIIKLGGLETETGYPYQAKNGVCELDRQKIKVHVNGSLELPEDEDELVKWLYQNGPISVGLNANAMQFYRGGISHPYNFLCSPEDLNHGVLIVGYGIHKYPLFKEELPYWIIKNSWGPKWGEQGYYRIYRGDGTCGVNRMATSAIIP